MSAFFFKNWHHFKQATRFLIAGGTSALVNFSLLYFFTDILGFWYLLSSVLSFIVSFFVSFYLQKFWTFGDKNKDILHKQLIIYLLLALFNLVVNTVLMYVLVDLFGLWYMLAQFFVTGTIATWNFMAYKFFVFNQEK
ncbi:MAG: GtrA family protein [Candidatus Falkowbacteria bacterium]